MPLVACKLGPAETTVGGTTYVFDRDAYGRFVTQVEDYHHLKCLIGLDAYEEVPAVPDRAEAPPVLAPAAEPPPPPAEPQQEPDSETLEAAKSGSEDATEPQEEEQGEDAPAPAADDLTRISGIGGSTAERLAEVGIKTYADVIALTEERIAELNTDLRLRNGIVNNQWVEQAKALEAAKSGSEA